MKIVTCKQCNKDFKSYPSQKRSYCCKDCFNKSKKGKSPPNIQQLIEHPMTQEIKDKIRKKMLGRKKSREHCENIRKAKKGFKHTQETKEKMSKIHKGSKRTEEVKKKMSIIFKAKGIRPPVNYGEKCGSWKGGVSKLNKTERNYAMSLTPYKLWRYSVFVRDDYTCQSCNQRGNTLHAHHKKSWAKYPELRFDLDNGITLCKTCHIDIHKIKVKGKTQ